MSRPVTTDENEAKGPSGLSAFLGTWEITREIAHADGSVQRLAGRVRFHRSGGQVIQDEEGDLELAPGRPALRATRRYLWRQEKGRLDCSFADNRPFHSVPLGVLRPETTYLCPPDRYHVAYDFADWPRWTSVWRVEGPRKDYRMETRFRPLRAPS